MADRKAAVNFRWAQNASDLLFDTMALSMEHCELQNLLRYGKKKERNEFS